MYRLDWIEQLKLRTAALPSKAQADRISPTIWQLGFTSLLTDISSEMANSMIPVYLVLFLHASPLAFGTIDGIYNGMAVALLSLGGGVLADRWSRHREVAVAGYGLSAVCKLGLIAAGASTPAIAGVLAIDRVGKGIRTAPRDALLSLSSAPGMLATSFAVHRAMDAGGSLLGPIAAFLLFSNLPTGYSLLWSTSFVFAILGVAVLWLFVKNPPRAGTAVHPPFRQAWGVLTASRQLRSVAVAGTLLAATSASDAFVYLMLQQQSQAAPQFFPLYYVATATVYMILSVPAGRLADRWGRAPVLLAGYGCLLVVYGTLASPSFKVPALSLLFYGAYYAATEGVLMAMASSVIPTELRTMGLAILTTGTGWGKLLSSVAFGWLWQSQGTQISVLVFSVALGVTLVYCWRITRSLSDEQLP